MNNSALIPAFVFIVLRFIRRVTPSVPPGIVDSAFTLRTRSMLHYTVKCPYKCLMKNDDLLLLKKCFEKYKLTKNSQILQKININFSKLQEYCICFSKFNLFVRKHI